MTDDPSKSLNDPPRNLSHRLHRRLIGVIPLRAGPGVRVFTVSSAALRAIAGVFSGVGLQTDPLGLLPARGQRCAGRQQRCGAQQRGPS